MDNICCLICKRTNVLDSEFHIIEEEYASASGKAIIYVLRHILKCTQIKLEIRSNSAICSKCFKFLLDYDEHVVKLMNLQKRFKLMYENPFNVDKIVFKTLRKRNIKPKEKQVNKKFIYEDDSEMIVEDFKDKPPERMSFEEDLIEIGTDAEASSEENFIFENSNVNSEKTIEDYNHPVQCNYCSQYFKNRGRLRKHVSEMHVKKESTCSICKLSLKDDEYLELHMNLHEGKTEYDCRYCDKRFTHKSSVIRHMHKHWDKKKYQCEKCGLRFSETPRLYNHKLLHEAEENPLICQICNQLCKTKRTYKRHMNTHRDDRPRYPCHICGKTFSEKFTLKPHLRTHEEYTETNSKKNSTKTVTSKLDNNTNSSQVETKEFYNCIICGNCFHIQDTYKKHMQTEHDVITWDS